MVAISFWNGLIWFYPLIIRVFPIEISAWIFKIFLPLCHHHPDSTFIIDSVYLPVCVRCSSIYLGILIGFLFSFIIYLFTRFITKNSFLPVVISGGLILADVGMNWLGLKEPFWSVKIITGSVFGIIISAFITLHLLQNIQPIRNHHD